MIQDLISTLCNEIGYKYNQMIDKAIYRALIKAEGKIPEPSVMSLFGMMVRSSRGSDNWEEFRWKGKGMFQIRLKFEDMRAIVEVKDL